MKFNVVGARSGGPGSLFLRKFLLMKMILLIAAFTAGCIRLSAQFAGPTQLLSCPGGETSARGAYAIPGAFWQVSTDHGQTWTVVPSSNYVYENGFIDVIIRPSLSDDQNLYQFCYSGTPNTCALPDTLNVPPGPLQSAQFVNPPSTVCVGTTALLSVTGDLSRDSVFWTIQYNGVTKPYFGAMNDISQLVNFPSAGTVTVTVDVYDGCSHVAPAVQTITVQPAPASLAGAAGSGPSCSTYPMYAGGQPTYFTPDAAQTTTATDGSCAPISAVLPSGTSPVSGTITSCVTVDASVQSFNGVPYVPRHYSLEPSANASTSTATVTLYFTQADFDAYNAARGSSPALPANPTDAAGISNLHITQFHGTGTTPGTYAGGSGDIDPDDNNIVWNAAASRWEVTFTITGFSGFFVSGSPIVVLPLTLTGFSGRATESGNLLSWTTATEENTAYFELQRGPAGGAVFTDVARIPAAGDSKEPLQYSYTDEPGGAPAAWSYRLKMADQDGKFTYSKVVTLPPPVSEITLRLIPNPFVQPTSLAVLSPVAGAAVLTVTDLSGKKLIERSLTLQKGENALDAGMLGGLASGMYLLRVATRDQQQTLKFIKE